MCGFALIPELYFLGHSVVGGRAEPPLYSRDNEGQVQGLQTGAQTCTQEGRDQEDRNYFFFN